MKNYLKETAVSPTMPISRNEMVFRIARPVYQDKELSYDSSSIKASHSILIILKFRFKTHYLYIRVYGAINRYLL